jgi:hypothetical protein
MKLFNFQLPNLVVDWISFNSQSLRDPRIIDDRLLKHFTPHIIIDDEVGIGFRGLQKDTKFRSINTQDPKVTGLGLKLFFLVKMLVTFLNFSKLEILI